MAAGRQPEMYCAVEKVGGSGWAKISHKDKANSSVCRLPVSFRQKGFDVFKTKAKTIL